MKNLNEAIYRLAAYYNNHTDVKGISAHHIVSDKQEDIYQDTCANFILKFEYSGSPIQIIEAQKKKKKLIVRFEPILHIRTVFTGNNALSHSSLHYQRIRKHLAKFDDMKLRNWQPFTDASIFFEGRYLIRYQSDAIYLVYLDIELDVPFIKSLDEDLRAYLTNKFTDLLTEREVTLNG